MPASDFGLALKVGQGDAAMKVARKLGVTDDEIARLGEAVVRALANDRLDPDGIRQAVGNATHSLGEEGKKKGVGTTLPLALDDLPNHGILDCGRLIGLWEYDPDAGRIAWYSFGVEDKALDAAVARTEAYVRDQLSDARAFSLDSPKRRAPRIQAIRAAAKA